MTFLSSTKTPRKISLTKKSKNKTRNCCFLKSLFDEEIKKLKEEFAAREETYNELTYQIRELDRKLESLDKSVEKDNYDLSNEKVVKEKTGVNSVLKKFFKKPTTLHRKVHPARENDALLDSNLDPKLIRPVKPQDIDFICKELIILLINQNTSLEEATKVFENKVAVDGQLSSLQISDALQVFVDKMAVYEGTGRSRADCSFLR